MEARIHLQRPRRVVDVVLSNGTHVRQALICQAPCDYLSWSLFSPVVDKNG